MDNLLVTTIFTVKIVYIIFSLLYLYLKSQKKENSDLGKNILVLKEKSELLFTILMAILLINLFNYRTGPSITISGHSKILLFLFGIILIITADWEKLLTFPPWFGKIQSVV